MTITAPMSLDCALLRKFRRPDRGVRAPSCRLANYGPGAVARLFRLAAAASGLWAVTGQAADARTALRTFFAFEREIWQETAGSRLALQTPKKHPDNPVIARGDGQAADSHRLSYTSLFPEEGKLRAWYTAMKKGGSYKDHAVGYAESADGVSWIKPKLNLVEPGTNLLLRGPITFVVTPDDTGREKSYRALAGFFRADVGTPAARGESGATFKVLTSKDGLRWDFDAQPATTVRHFEAYGLFHRNRQWWVLGQGVSPYFHLPDGREHGRVMYGFHSADGANWDLYPKPLFHYPINAYFREASLQNHMGAAVWDRGRVLIGLMGQFWPAGFSAGVRMTIGLTYSYDGIDWTEPFAQTPQVKPGPAGAWDSGCVIFVQRPVSRGDSTYVYYSGFDGGNEWSSRAAIGLATLRRDGFAALAPEQENVRLVTKSVSLLAGETTLYLNSRGAVTVQVLDEYLRPLGSPQAISGDGVRTPTLNVKELNRASPFHLAFTLQTGAELYSFSFGPDPDKLGRLENWE